MILALGAWAGVGLTEYFSLQNIGPLVFVVPNLELALWLAAILLTLRALPGRALRAGAGVVLLGPLVHFTNWATFEPHSYFAAHRYAFDAVADGVRAGTIGSGSEYYGEPLPRYLADLSTTGRAAVVGRAGDRPAVFLPQFVGFPDDAAGYLHLDGDPGSLQVDLFGDPVTVAGGAELGGGWWYVPGR